MGLQSDIQDAVKEAFDDDLSDVVIAFNFITEVEGAYDSSTDSRPTVETKHLSRGVFSVVDNKLVDGINIKQKDEMAVVNGLDLLASLLAITEPVIDMEIELTDTALTRYKIVDPGRIAGGNSSVIVFNMQVRKSGTGIRS